MRLLFILSCLFSLFFAANSTYAQRIQLRFANVRATCDGELFVTLQAKAETATPFELGNSSVVFSYNPAAVANPVLVQEFNFTNQPCGGSVNYASQAFSFNQPLGVASLGIVLNNANSGCPTLSNSAWTNVAQFEFTIVGGATNAGFVFNQSLTSFIDDSNLPTGEITNGNFDNLPEFEPYQFPEIVGSHTLCEGKTVTLAVQGGPYTSILWQPGGQTGGVITAGEGTYFVTATDTFGCTSTSAAFSVTKNEFGLTPVIEGNGSLCANSTVTLSVPNTFGTYSWSNGVTGLNQITVSLAGSYSVLVTDTTGCQGVALPFTVSPAAAANPGAILGTNILCEGQSSLITAPFGYESYLWSPGGFTNQSIEVFTPGTYIVTVTDSSGCTGTTSIDMVQIVVPNPIVTGAQPLCSGDSTILSVANESSYASYKWVGTSVSDTSLLVTTPGTYTVIATTNSGCELSTTVTIGGPPSAQASVDQNNICLGKTIKLTGASDNGLLFVWNPGGIQGTSINVTPTVSTTYTLLVANTDGCTATSTVSVQVGAGLPLAIFGSSQFCAGDTATLSATPGFAQYVWSPGNSVTSVPQLKTTNGGAYTVFAVDTAGCVGQSDTFNLTKLVVDVVTISGPQSFCAGDTAVISVNPSTYSTYLWQPGNIVTSVPQLKTVNSGAYSVTVTSANGCFATSNILNVTRFPLPTASATASPNITCVGGKVTLTATGGVSYVWQPGTLVGASQVVSPPLGVNTYTVTVTSAAGCTSTATVQVTAQTTLVPPVSGNLSFCAGGSTTLSAPAGFASYVWSTGAVTPSITVSAAGAYSVTVSDGVSCTGTSNPVNVIQNPLPTPTIAGGGIFCPGTVVTLVATPGFVSYVWTSNTGLTSTNDSIQASAGQYTVTVTDANGCVGTSATTTLSANFSANAGNNIFANPNGVGVTIGGTPAAVGGAGGYTYSWTPSTGLSASNIPNPTAKPDTTTTYILHVTDAQGCVATDDITVSVGIVVPPTPLAVDAVNVGQVFTCFGVSQPLQAQASGGFSPYKFVWAPAASLNDSVLFNPTATPLVTTTYTVTVIDASGATAKDSIIIFVKPHPTVSAGRDTAVCIGSAVPIGGTPTATGGAGPFTYAWQPTTGLNNPTAANPLASPAITTAYTLTVSDPAGCSYRDTVLVSAVSPSNLSVFTSAASVCSSDSVTLNANTTGGFGTLKYKWAPSAGLSSDTVLTPKASPFFTTTYTLTVSDQVGCKGVNTLTVSVFPKAVAKAGPDKIICPNGSTTLGLTTTPGAFLYQWSPAVGLSNPTAPQTTANPSVTTTYILNVIGAGNCVAADTVVVTVTPPANAIAGFSRSVCTGSTTVLGDTLIPGQTYSWAPAAGLDNPASPNPTATVNATTTYTLTVTQAGGCTASAVVALFAVEPIVASLNANEYVCATNPQVKLMPTISGGSGNYVYSWSPAAGLSDSTVKQPFASPTQTTTYSLTISNASGQGCTASAFVTVQVFGSTAVSIVADPGASLCAGQTATLSAIDPDAIGYVWEKDSVILTNETAAQVKTNTAGTFRVKALYPAGCASDFSAPVAVVVNPAATKPSITFDGTSFSVVNPDSAGQYQWLLNGAPLTGATQTSVLAGVSGNYSVQYTDANGCIAISQAKGTANARPEAAESLLTVYPNPSNGAFNLSLYSADAGSVFVQVADISGRVVYSTNQPVGQGHNLLTFNLSDQPKGLYLLNAVVGLDRFTTKIIIQ